MGGVRMAVESDLHAGFFSYYMCKRKLKIFPMGKELNTNNPLTNMVMIRFFVNISCVSMIVQSFWIRVLKNV